MRRLVGSLVLVVMTIPSPGWAKPNASLVTVVHGLPRFVADIYVNGELTLSAFEPRESTDPFELPSGDYLIEIRDAGSPEGSEPALATDVAVPAGENLSIVAHLTENGSPTVSVFENDLTPVQPGNSHLVVRHQAQAPPINVQVKDDLLLRHLASGEEAGKEVSAGSARVAFMGLDGTALVKATPVEFQEGAAYFLYLIGSNEDQTLDVMVEAVSGVQTPPSGVDTGHGGLAAEDGLPTWAWLLMTSAGAALAASALDLLLRRRSVRP
jgi:hypothetical protein